MAVDQQELVDLRELLYRQGEQLLEVTTLLGALIQRIGAIDVAPVVTFPEVAPQVVVSEQDPQILIDAVERSFSPPLAALAEVVAGMRGNIDSLAEKITQGPPTILRGGSGGITRNDLNTSELAKDLTLRDGSTHVAVDSMPSDLDVRNLTSAQDSIAAVQSGLWSSVPDRPTEKPGRESICKTTTSVAASTNLHTVSSGKTFYMTSAQLMFRNTDITTAGAVSVNDSTGSGNRKMYGIVGVWTTGTVTPSHSLEMEFAEPIAFTDTVRLEVVSGSITACLTITGYEE